MIINYEVLELTDNVPPEGEGWEYRGMKITPEGEVYVWRRIVEDVSLSE